MNPEIIAQTSEKMIATGRDTYETRLAAGQARLKLKEYKQAIEHLNQATRLKPDRTMAWQELGKALLDDGNAVQARNAWQTGLNKARQNGDKQAEKVISVWLKRLTNT